MQVFALFYALPADILTMSVAYSGDDFKINHFVNLCQISVPLTMCAWVEHLVSLATGVPY